ncbi:hypothetical protein [Fictibacillus fluitans]|uniref:Uncharacterized protein n=1 Tax=Fictibacillus fluitans TaxID=3058422 RepID=A0ABT8HSQ3_9BACL|nr:hypothetical protein [Fictibacillus sp. NE201]MDN4523292.1 hypothetical protein [Fictibacillus sp. NE201]
MVIDLYFDGQKKGSINAADLYFYVTYFEQKGFKLSFNPLKKRLTVLSGRSRQITIHVDGKADEREKRLAAGLSDILSAMGILTTWDEDELGSILNVYLSTKNTNSYGIMIEHGGGAEALMRRLKKDRAISGDLFRFKNKWFLLPLDVIKLQIGLNSKQDEALALKHLQLIGFHFGLGIAEHYKQGGGEEVDWNVLFPAGTVRHEEKPAEGKESSSSDEKTYSADLVLDYTVFHEEPLSGEDALSVTAKAIMTNTGSLPIAQPMLCLRFSPPGKMKLNGKLFTAERLQEITPNQMNLLQDAWRYVEADGQVKARETGDYWLRPVVSTTLNPGQQLIFDFQLSFSPLAEGEGISCAAFMTGSNEEVKTVSKNTIRITR